MFDVKADAASPLTWLVVALAAAVGKLLRFLSQTQYNDNNIDDVRNDVSYGAVNLSRKVEEYDNSDVFLHSWHYSKIR